VAYLTTVMTASYRWSMAYLCELRCVVRPPWSVPSINRLVTASPLPMSQYLYDMEMVTGSRRAIRQPFRSLASLVVMEQDALPVVE